MTLRWGFARPRLWYVIKHFTQQTEFLTPLSFPLKAHRRKRAAAELTLDELKKEDRVGVHIEPMCIFLFRDGNFLLPRPVASFSLPVLVVRDCHIVQLKTKS
jgi:hypothetical protein